MIPVVAVALIDNEQRVLMQQRRIGGAHGGLWEFPGGKVEAAETLQSALLREIEEELGIHLAKDSLKPLSFAATADEPYVVLLYTCRAWQGTPVCLEGEGIAWVPAQDLLGLAMPPLDVPLARALQECLRR
ncbi:(deoxy)nucleoside triphosphate pyrophosphohydrolase [Novosphingobium sp.]|uniref:(deoxy)nucleoside triphosphate pyrophosphohydrolase n=1 Tax=Novosphingobium sp. TaxID=1874826 RepID=UPI0035B04EFA